MSVALLAAVVLAQSKPQYLVNDGLIIGYRQGGTWHSISNTPSKKMPINLRHAGIGIVLGGYTAKGIDHVQNGPEAMYIDGDEDSLKGVSFSGQVTVPRSVHIISNGDQVAVRILGAFLRAHGVSSRPRFTRIIRADLDGQGNIETILEASSRDDLTHGGMSEARKGDYSVVLLRYTYGGKTANKVLLFDHPKAGGMPFMNKVVGVADFEGHGTMQVVLTSSYYEGVSTSLWRYSRGVVSKIVENGVGA